MIIIMDYNSFGLTSLASLVSCLGSISEVMSPCSSTHFFFLLYGVATMKSELLVMGVQLCLVTMTCCRTMQSLRHGARFLRHRLRPVA